jgi:hypothetical protein
MGNRVSDKDPKWPLAPGDIIPTISGGLNYKFDLGAKLGEWTSALDFIPTNLHSDIRAGTSVVDVTTYIQAALDYLDALGGGTLFLPRGLYTKSGIVNLPKRVTIQGAGRKASVFRHTGNGTGFASTWPINSSTIVDINLRDFGIVATTAAPPLAEQPSRNLSNTGHGIYEQGGAYVSCFNLWVYGFDTGIVYNQTELAEIDLCCVEKSISNNIWLVGAAGFLGTEDGGYTNRISVTRCQLNAPGDYNILDDGGVAHAFRDNNYNGAGINHVHAAAVVNLTIAGGEWEGAEGHCVEISSLSGTGAGVGFCAAVTIIGAQFSMTSANSGINIVSCDNISIIGCFFTSTTDPAIAAISGLNNVNKLFEAGSSWDSTLLFDTAGAGGNIRSMTAVVNGSATYNPPSLAAGAKTPLQTITVAGAEVGDPVECISFTGILPGARISAEVTAANTLSYYLINENGADPIDMPSGTAFAEVRRRHF